MHWYVRLTSDISASSLSLTTSCIAQEIANLANKGVGAIEAMQFPGDMWIRLHFAYKVQFFLAYRICSSARPPIILETS
jgi:hypothetical protein